MAGLHDVVAPFDRHSARAAPRTMLEDRSEVAAALLQPEDLAGAITVPVPSGHWRHLRPPMPGSVVYPSRTLCQVQRAAVARYAADELPRLVIEHVGVYLDGGAAGYLGELRRALSRPHGLPDESGHWTAVDDDVIGDESLLVRLREPAAAPGAATPRIHSRFVLVARVGVVVVVLGDLGSDCWDGREAVVRHLAAPALFRAAKLGYPSQAR